MKSRIVAVSDFCDGVPPSPSRYLPEDFDRAWARDAGDHDPSIKPLTPVSVVGGYLERLPLAAVAAGLVDAAEVWQFAGRDDAWFDSAGLLDHEARPDRGAQRPSADRKSVV